ncbi:hypothetical protein [Methylobacterium trifolii]|uniref:Uncharacterized protein n=1 Tax=Methylobacterium trifolii TaxID=1003092 RepID=A0ABQ4U5V6_9HYPH|nr:hypothetical protein [Methylobacterium trifolii]GJE61748.1 hypothetical protein MPOCJGCO_3873 [Methylobacterium trifolii]
MSKAILYRNDDQNDRKKSALVYRNVEAALSRMARAEGRELRPNFSLDGVCRPRKGTAYASAHSVVSIGLTAHERLANIVKTSLIYLDPHPSRATQDRDITRLITCAGTGRTTSRVSLLGQRARQVSTFLPKAEARLYDLPPVDLSGEPSRPGDTPRLTIVNHLDDDRLARTITARFLDTGTFFIECVGLDGEPHNCVRYLRDDEVSDFTSSIHIHIGGQADDSERLRIWDSWQSRIPVLCFDYAPGDPQGGWPADLRDRHNVLSCNSYGEACEFLSLLLDTPNLYRQLADNGRASAAPAARSWDSLARDLVA